MPRFPFVLAVVVIGLLLLAGAGCWSTSSRYKPTPALSFNELVTKVRSGIVRVDVSRCGGRRGVGTGFLIGPRLVATVGHVVDQSAAISLMQYDEPVAGGVVIGRDAEHDLALVQTDRPIDGYVFKLSPERTGLGIAVGAIGFPLGGPLTSVRGFVTSVDGVVSAAGTVSRGLLLTNAPLTHGDSRAPLFTWNGDVVGLVDALSGRPDGNTIAVSSEVAYPLIEAWTADPRPVRPVSCLAPPA